MLGRFISWPAAAPAAPPVPGGRKLGFAFGCAMTRGAHTSSSSSSSGSIDSGGSGGAASRCARPDRLGGASRRRAQALVWPPARAMGTAGATNRGGMRSGAAGSVVGLRRRRQSPAAPQSMATRRRVASGRA
eukprot:351462-Chlamydomonas_euryale.AAC.6